MPWRRIDQALDINGCSVTATDASEFESWRSLTGSRVHHYIPLYWGAFPPVSRTDTGIPGVACLLFYGVHASSRRHARSVVFIGSVHIVTGKEVVSVGSGHRTCRVMIACFACPRVLSFCTTTLVRIDGASPVVTSCGRSKLFTSCCRETGADVFCLFDRPMENTTLCLDAIAKTEHAEEISRFVREYVTDPVYGWTSIASIVRSIGKEYVRGPECGKGADAIEQLGFLALADSWYCSPAMFKEEPTHHAGVLASVLTMYSRMMGYTNDSEGIDLVSNSRAESSETGSHYHHNDSLDIWIPLRCCADVERATGDCEDMAMEAWLLFADITCLSDDDVAGRPVCKGLRAIARGYDYYLVMGPIGDSATGAPQAHQYGRLVPRRVGALPFLVVDGTCGLTPDEFVAAPDTDIMDHCLRCNSLCGEYTCQPIFKSQLSSYYNKEYFYIALSIDYIARHVDTQYFVNSKPDQPYGKFSPVRKSSLIEYTPTHYTRGSPVIGTVGSMPGPSLPPGDFAMCKSVPHAGMGDCIVYLNVSKMGKEEVDEVEREFVLRVKSSDRVCVRSQSTVNPFGEAVVLRFVLSHS